MSRDYALRLTNKMAGSDTLKPEFISTLINALPSTSPRRANVYLKAAIDETYRVVDKLHQAFKVDTSSLVDAVLESAEYGLQFGKEVKQCFLHMHVSERESDKVYFTLGLHYRGMKSRLIKACGVTDINTTVIYSDDTFEWRGQLTPPFYVKSNSTSDMVGAFSVAILKNGRVKACHMPIEELIAIEELDRKNMERLYGNANESFYQGSWRNRMFEIAAMRRLYRELEPDLNTPIEMEDLENVRNEDLEMAKALELQITESTEQANRNLGAEA
jgi:recombinational DNA repair protein RecT